MHFSLHVCLPTLELAAPRQGGFLDQRRRLRRRERLAGAGSASGVGDAADPRRHVVCLLPFPPPASTTGIEAAAAAQEGGTASARDGSRRDDAVMQSVQAGQAYFGSDGGHGSGASLLLGVRAGLRQAACG